MTHLTSLGSLLRDSVLCIVNFVGVKRRRRKNTKNKIKRNNRVERTEEEKL
jgi:hypothetical protein